MAFKTEELATKVFPLLAIGGCPQDTASKGHPPCPQHTHPPCPGHSNQPCNGPSVCPQDTAPPTGPGRLPGPGKREAAGLDRSGLALLRAQLRDRLMSEDGMR